MFIVQHHLKRYVACMDVITSTSRQIQIRNRSTKDHILVVIVDVILHTYSPSPHNGDTMRRRRGRARRWKKEENDISLVDSDTRKKHQSSNVWPPMYTYKIYTYCGHLYRRTLTLAMLPPGSDWRVRRARSPPPLMCPGHRTHCVLPASHAPLMCPTSSPAPHMDYPHKSPP